MLKKLEHFMPLTDRESTPQNITESSPDPDVLHIPYWTIQPHPVADPDPFRATGTLWLISKIGNLAMKSETVHMRPVNQDAAHLQALSLPREDLQAATQAEAEGRGQRAEVSPVHVPVSVPDAGRDKRCRRLTFCHPNLPQSLPPPLQATPLLGVVKRQWQRGRREACATCSRIQG